MRKKLLTVLLTILMIFTITGCDTNGFMFLSGNNIAEKDNSITATINSLSKTTPNEPKEAPIAVSLSTAVIENGDLILIMSDGSKINVGRVQGEKGDKGEQGEKGDRGDKGEQGAQGVKGDKGEQGAQGAKGDKGEQGAQGAKGDKGESGSNGSSTTNLTISNFQSDVVTDSVSSASTDSQLPTAKSVFDGLNGKLNNNLGTANADKYLKVNSDGSIITDSISSIDIADNLTTDDNTKALSAKQGKALNDTKANITDTYSKSEVDDLFEAFFNVMYPVGSQYTSYDKNFDPNNTEGWNGTWVKIEEGYFVEATVTPDLIGTKKDAGLPNIEGYFEIQRSKWEGSVIDATGGSLTSSYSGTSSSAKIDNGDSNPWLNRQKISFSASLSNPIYGNSTTVQPKSILAYIWKRVE